MAPAQQRLRPHHAVGTQVDDGLEQQAQLALLQGDVEISLEADEIRGLSGHARGVDDHLLSRAPFGDGQCNVGLPHDVFRPLLP